MILKILTASIIASFVALICFSLSGSLVFAKSGSSNKSTSERRLAETKKKKKKKKSRKKMQAKRPAKSKNPLQTNGKALSREVVFSGSTVKGQYHSAGEAVTKVEQEKQLNDLIGMRRDYKDRLTVERDRLKRKEDAVAD